VTAQAQLQHYHFGKVSPSRANQGLPKTGGIEEEWLVGKYLIIRTFKMNKIIFDLIYSMPPDS
jgi:hypothetical protein